MGVMKKAARRRPDWGFLLVDVDQTEVFKVRNGLGVLAPARLGEKSIAPFAKSIKVK